MNRRTERLAARAVIVCSPAIGIAYLVWAWVVPIPLSEKSGLQRSTIAVGKIEQVDMPPRFNPDLLARRLQGPPPPAEPEPEVSERKAVDWPQPLELECLFVGPNSSLAVIICQGNKYTCGPGESAGPLVVEEVDADSVKVSFEGISRKLLLKTGNSK